MDKRLWIVNCQLFLLVAVSAISEATFAQTKPQTNLCDSVSPVASAAAIVAAYQHKDCMSEIADIDSAKKLVQTLNLDVLKYYELKELYDTEEKQAEFKKTNEYKEKLAQLTSQKKDALSQYFYSVLTNNLGKFSWAFKGYKFDMDKLITPGGLTGAPPPPSTMFYDIDLSRLPFAVTGNDQTMTLLVDPEKGMDIDRNKNNDIVTMVFYKLDKVVEKEYSYFNEQCHCNRNAKEEVIKTKFDRVIIFNVATNDVYYDESFDKSSGK